LDRDGTIIVDRAYPCDPDGVALLPGVAKPLRKLQDAGFLLVIVSNQSAVGRGLCTVEEVHAVNQRMAKMLADAGVRLTRILYCPHTPEDGCRCRKPKPGMILAAAEQLAVDVSCSAMVGDNETDAAAGAAAGCRLNFLLGDGPDTRERLVVPDLRIAAAQILDTLL